MSAAPNLVPRFSKSLCCYLPLVRTTAFYLSFEQKLFLQPSLFWCTFYHEYISRAASMKIVCKHDFRDRSGSKNTVKDIFKEG